MAERVDTETTETTERSSRRRPELLTLLCGLATLYVAGYVLSDGRLWVPVLDLRWVLTGGALVIGALLLGASLRGGRRGR